MITLLEIEICMDIVGLIDETGFQESNFQEGPIPGIQFPPLSGLLITNHQTQATTDSM
jgi:hypothetical protein